MRQRILAGIILGLTAATSSAALLGRAPLTPNGTDYLAYYDTVLNITWLADANLAESQTFGLSRTTAYPPEPGRITNDGRMRLDTARTWLAAMNAASYLGVSDWRLPSMDVNDDTIVADSITDCFLSEVVCRDNELAYQAIFNHIHDCPGPPFSCHGEPFANVELDYYWSSTPVAGHPSSQRVFYFPLGENAAIVNTVGLYVWAVRPGDIGVVPIPAAAWLLGSALGLLAWVKRKVSA